MKVRTKRRKVRVALPGSETHYIEVCEFNRRGRNRWNDALESGARDRQADAMFQNGVSDFLLPGDEGDQKFTGTVADYVVFDNLDEDLEDFIINRVAMVNNLVSAEKLLELERDSGLIERLAGEGGDELGNLESSPGASCEAIPPSGSESEIPTQPDS